MSTKSNIASLLLALSSLFLIQNPAQALTIKYDCADSVDYSYHCASMFGYKGIDPYGYSNVASTRLDGSYPHNCTSFAAYMLYDNNKFDENIALLGNASEWDNRAYLVTGASVSTAPHVGDIAVWDYFGGPAGHVAFVYDLITNSSGNTIGVVIVDDQYGNRRTTMTRYYKRDTVTNLISNYYPDHFISFPKNASGGGKGWDMLSVGKVAP